MIRRIDVGSVFGIAQRISYEYIKLLNGKTDGNFKTLVVDDKDGLHSLPFANHGSKVVMYEPNKVYIDGGTIDGIVKINGAYYIIDFKTSKKISLEHVLQTSAYMWAINSGYTALPHINGIGIIRVDKAMEHTFDDLFLTETNPEQALYINQFQRCFCSLVDSYYRSVYSENLFKVYNDNYNFSNVMG